MPGDTRLVLLSHTPDPQRVCTLAARLSSLPGLPTKIYEETPEGGHPDYLRRILRMGHKSVMEHANFTVAFENVSVFAEQYMITHRLMSYTVKSRRYVSHADAGYVVPYLAPEGETGLFNVDDKPYVGPEFYGPLSQRYLHYCEGLFLAYKRLLQLDIPAEDARFVLPYSFKSNFIVTGNARNWTHFIYEALHGRGKLYSEIAWLGSTLQEMLSRIAPAIFTKIETFEFGGWDGNIVPENITRKYGNNKRKTLGVDLISYTPEPDKIVAKSAVIAKLGSLPDDIEDILTDSVESEIVDKILSNRHARELEQANFTFALHGMSLPMLTHLSRHRMQNILMPDLTDLGTDNHVVEPESVSNNPEAHSVFQSARRSRDSFQEAMDRFNVIKENRIYACLSGQAVSAVTTMNARELHHFLTLRTCLRAQWEIREYADKMLQLAKSVSPKIFKNAGPGCVRYGKCREGRMSCGKSQEMRRKYLGE
ncbi:MAG TPA: FAD-dependent thymidylate synthase [Caldisericia bacterium]|nr:FAD-dependent thymidylate synthase [Caldisericia bacterium]HPF48427.1 FAD-dependent thymidylate synthase [Caldisericia bacterium]HPI83393.1 FAD-dependent thymidylate synthase [Caldisericia bacterium]HPQ92881.1 FAD-dependent thymidylate synthase [Caldisericia bacterium]HRV74021.1 FAD-dependent thymidylate synthase [Caldisericia bacterium]